MRPEECVFADDREDNIEAARAYGMHGIVFKDCQQYKAELSAIFAREGSLNAAPCSPPNLSNVSVAPSTFSCRVTVVVSL